jgi:hypothetical protein
MNWTKEIKKHLVGKTIKNVRYLTDEEMEEFMWYKRPVVIFFTDGSYMIPSADDEGNDGGAIFTSFKGLEVIPVNGN